MRNDIGTIHRATFLLPRWRRRRLGKRVKEDILSIGKHLIEARDHGADDTHHDHGHDHPDDRLKVEPAPIGGTDGSPISQSSVAVQPITEERQVVVLEQFFDQASGAEIYAHISAAKRAEILAAFSVKDVIKVFGEQLRAALPANPILKLRAMDDNSAASALADAFGPRLDAIVQLAQNLRAPQGRKAGKQSDKAPKHKMTLAQAGVDPRGNQHFAQSRGTRSRPH